MSVSRKIRGFMGVGLSLVSAVCVSQVSFAETKTWVYEGVKYNFKDGVLRISAVCSNKVSKSWNKENNINRDKITEIVVEDGINDIGTFAFKDCESLKKVTLPNSLKHIGQFAFKGCVSLEEVTAEDYGMPGVESKEFISEEPYLDVVDKNGVSLPVKREKYLFNPIEPFAFQGCISLKIFVVPNLIETIYELAFDRCINLKEVVATRDVVLRKLALKNTPLQEYSKDETIFCGVITAE